MQWVVVGSAQTHNPSKCSEHMIRSAQVKGETPISANPAYKKRDILEEESKSQKMGRVAVKCFLMHGTLLPCA